MVSSKLDCKGFSKMETRNFQKSLVTSMVPLSPIIRRENSFTQGYLKLLGVWNFAIYLLHRAACKVDEPFPSFFRFPPFLFPSSLIPTPCSLFTLLHFSFYPQFSPSPFSLFLFTLAALFSLSTLLSLFPLVPILFP